MWYLWRDSCKIKKKFRMNFQKKNEVNYPPIRINVISIGIKPLLSHNLFQ